MKCLCTTLFLGGLAFLLYLVVDQSGRHDHRYPGQDRGYQSIAARPGGAIAWH
jgi:hypothetical protein